MRKPKSILLRLAGLEGKLDEELARLALLRSQGKLLWPGGKIHPKRQTIRAKIDFFRAMIKVTENGCWEWQGQKDFLNGYGIMEIGCLSIRPHRFSFCIFNQKEPEHCVCHHCDNRLCVNPDHFFDGTYRQNRKDCVRKNRHSPPIGEKNCKAKLTESDVKEVRASSERTIVLAQRFGVSQTNIQMILRGATWKHLLPYGE